MHKSGELMRKKNLEFVDFLQVDPYISVEPRVFACRQVRDRLDIVRIYSRRKWIVPLFAHSYKQCNCEDALGPLFDFRK